LPYQWILFDADGTLFDYDRAESSALKELFATAGTGELFATAAPANDDGDLLLDTYRRINSALWKQLEAGEVTADEIKTRRFQSLLDELELEGDPHALSTSYLECLGRQTYLLPGAAELLDSLSDTHRLALITNGLSSVQRSRLRLSPVGARFEIVVISEEIGFAKPDPRVFDAAFEAMGGPHKDEVLMVGDNLFADIGGGKSYGMATCWFNLDGRGDSDGVGPTFEVHHLRQLQELLGR
jgi:YjjG family noncanonical pyrimidine nucleotidase